MGFYLTFAHIIVEKSMKIFGLKGLIYNFIFAVCVLSLGAFTVFYSHLYVQKKYIYPIKYEKMVKQSVNEFELDVYLVYAVIKTESGFDANALSEKGAVGLMQIMPSTASFIAKELGASSYDLYDANCNIRFGCFYLKYLLEKYKSVPNAIIAYNAGEGRVNNWLKDTRYSKDGITIENIPIKETKEYLEKCEKSYNKYKSLYKNLLDKI